MRSDRPSCMMYDEQIRFESTVKIHSKLFNRSREVGYLHAYVESLPVLK